MRPTSIVALCGLVVVGIIIADFLTHPTGTTDAFNGVASLATPAENSLLGYTSTGQ
jgi:hypothetical protein